MTEKKITTKTAVKKTETKAVVKKTPVKVAGEAPIKKASVKNEAVASEIKLSIGVVDTFGKAAGVISLPAEIFGSQINEVLMAQAVRVYLANQRDGGASTKTRSTVIGSTRKIYRQKGTGRARHGAAKAPIFVHGGVAHGPHPRDYSLSMPQKMRRRALFSALASKLHNNEIQVVSGFLTMEPKTKVMAATLKALTLHPKKKSVLIVTTDNTAPVVKSVRNIEGTTYLPASLLNTYLVLSSSNIIFMKEAIETLEKHFLPKETK